MGGRRGHVSPEHVLQAQLEHQLKLGAESKCCNGMQEGCARVLGTEAEVHLAPAQVVLLGIKVLLVHCSRAAQSKP